MTIDVIVDGAIIGASSGAISGASGGAISNATSGAISNAILLFPPRPLAGNEGVNLYAFVHIVVGFRLRINVGDVEKIFVEP